DIFLSGRALPTRFRNRENDGRALQACAPLQTKLVCPFVDALHSAAREILKPIADLAQDVAARRLEKRGSLAFVKSCDAFLTCQFGSALQNLLKWPELPP